MHILFVKQLFVECLCVTYGAAIKIIRIAIVQGGKEIHN